MGQLFAATSSKEYAYDNVKSDGNSMVIDDERKCTEPDWYMNKIDKFKPIKVLSSSGGHDQRKTRSMVDLVMRVKEEEEDLCAKQVLSIPRNDIPQSNSILSSVQTIESEDELEKMTLGEMRSFLKKSSRGPLKSKNKSNLKSPKKTVWEDITTTLPLTNTCNRQINFDLSLEVDSPFEGSLEVKQSSLSPTPTITSDVSGTHVSTSGWLLAHTCNASSVEDTMNTGNSTMPSAITNTSHMQVNCVSKDSCVSSERQSGLRKRPFDDPIVSSLSNHKNVIDDDDSMTLGMWQLHKKSKTSSKRKKRKMMSKGVENLPVVDSSFFSLNTVSNVDKNVFEESGASGCTQMRFSLISQGCTPSGTVHIKGTSRSTSLVQESQAKKEEEFSDQIVYKRDTRNIENEGLSSIDNKDSCIFDNECSKNIDTECSRNIENGDASKISNEILNNMSNGSVINTVNVSPSEMDSNASNTSEKDVSSNDSGTLSNINSCSNVVSVTPCTIGSSVSNTVKRDVLSNNSGVLSKIRNDAIGIIDCEGVHTIDNQVVSDPNKEVSRNIENKDVSKLEQENLSSFNLRHQPVKSPELLEKSDEVTSLICPETLELESPILGTDHVPKDALLQSDETIGNTVIEHGNGKAIFENIDAKASIENLECHTLIENSQASTDDSVSNINREQTCSIQMGVSSCNTELHSENRGNFVVFGTVEYNRGIVEQCKKVASDSEEVPPAINYIDKAGCTEDISLIDLYSTEKLGVEEEQHHDHVTPSKIPCKRKAISPLSREKLIKASRLSDEDVSQRGMKKLPRSFKCYIGRDNFNQGLQDVNAWTKGTPMNEISPPRKFSQKEEVAPGSPCHNRQKSLFTKPSKIPSLVLSECSPPKAVEDLSLVLNSSPSPPTLQATNSTSLLKVSPFLPTKGILRSASPGCKGACRCDECASLRLRSERAVEFSQQQMHDIEGLTVKLLKELNTMRGVLEETLFHGVGKLHSPTSARCLDKARMIANSAVEAEKMAKTWLVRMARDCNRYCKIMRMQQRKLTFADESGGQLCQVKLFRSKPNKHSYESVTEGSPNSSLGVSSSNDIETMSVLEATN